MMATSAAQHSFRHEALLYAQDDGFLAATLPFVRAAIARREPILVVVQAAKIDGLRRELGDDTAQVAFEDMAGVGTNPARIILARVRRHAQGPRSAAARHRRAGVGGAQRGRTG
jgi:MEDS: MEthanogen/methylotroph, DcmR Sensory domain